MRPWLNWIELWSSEPVVGGSNPSGRSIGTMAENNVESSKYIFTQVEMDDNKPLSLAELKQLRKPVRNVAQVHKESFTTLEKLAIYITNKVGTPGFFLIILGWTLVWLLWNTIGPDSFRFDPYPAFVLWLFISNMIQILLLPLIMVGQNLQGRYAEIRAEEDYEINKKAEREIEAVLHHLELQHDHFEKILQKLEEKK